MDRIRGRGDLPFPPRRHTLPGLSNFFSLQLQIPNDVTRKSPENVRPYPTPTRATVSSGESLLFGRPTEKPLISIHPQPVQIFRLWQICLDNVNPLVKLFHAPTVQQLIIEASSDLENVNRFTESLMFAIYLSSVTSLGDEECRSLMGDSKALLLARFSGGTQQALINAEVLSSSNPVVLQAYTLFLVCLILLSLVANQGSHNGNTEKKRLT